MTEVLIINGGRSYHWGQIALAFERAGYKTRWCFWKSGIIADLVSRGALPDIVVTTRHYGGQLHNELFMTSGIRPECIHFKLVMFQYDDIFQEMDVYCRMQDSFKRNGFNIELYLWTYCRASFEFVLRTGLAIRAFFSLPPFYPDVIVSPPEKGDSDESISGRLQDRSLFLRAFSPNIRERYQGRIVYFGNYNPLDIANISIGKEYVDIVYQVAVDFLSNNRHSTVHGFITELLRQNVTTLERRNLNQIADFGAVYSLIRARIERCALISEVFKRFKDRLALFGAGWEQIGIPARPPDAEEAMAVYPAAGVCLDSGSIFLDTCLYQRSHEIIAMNGVLLQKRHTDTGEVFGEFADHIVFNSPEEVGDAIEALLRSEAAPPVGFEQFIATRLDGDRVIRTVLEAIGAPF